MDEGVSKALDFERRMAETETHVAVLVNQMEDVEGGVAAARELQMAVSRYAQSVEGLGKDVGYLRAHIERRDEERRKERLAREQERREDRIREKEERRSNRRWIVGTILTSAGLIVGATAFLVQNL